MKACEETSSVAVLLASIQRSLSAHRSGVSSQALSKQWILSILIGLYFLTPLTLFSAQQEPSLEIAKGPLFDLVSNNEAWGKYIGSFEVTAYSANNFLPPESSAPKTVVAFILEKKPATLSEYKEFISEREVSQKIVINIKKKPEGERFRVFSHVVELKLGKVVLRAEIGSSKMDWLSVDLATVVFVLQSSDLQSAISDGSMPYGPLSVAPVSMVGK